MSTREIAALRVRAVRWVSDDPFPGLVEAQLTDHEGRSWSFIDKPPIFTRDDSLGPNASYPVDLEIACAVVERRPDAVVVSTAEPWGVETADGVSQFTVSPEQLCPAPN